MIIINKMISLLFISHIVAVVAYTDQTVKKFVKMPLHLSQSGLYYMDMQIGSTLS
jgi:putative effector of murein hydrolase LrgA (UPF0299 family)